MKCCENFGYGKMKNGNFIVTTVNAEIPLLQQATKFVSPSMLTSCGDSPKATLAASCAMSKTASQSAATPQRWPSQEKRSTSTRKIQPHLICAHGTPYEIAQKSSCSSGA